MSSDSEEYTSLIPHGLSPLPEEVEVSEERQKDEDVFDGHGLETDEQSSQVNAVDIVDVKTAM